MKKVWTCSEIRSLLNASNFPAKGWPHEAEMVAIELNTGVLSVRSESISLIADPKIEINLSSNEKEQHRNLKRCVVAWLRAKGEKNVDTEVAVNSGMADVVSEHYVVECGDTDASKIHLTFDREDVRWAIFPRFADQIRFKGFRRAKGGQIFVFTNHGGKGRYRAFQRELMKGAQVVMKGLCEDLGKP